MRNNYLLIGGIMSKIAALLHIGIILGGPDWYRFFGAGEGMAQMAEQKMIEPIITTLFIFVVLSIFALYAFSATGVIGTLPFRKVLLYGIAAIFLLRGLFGIPAILLIEHPYLLELREKMVFMIISSLIVTFMGWMYALGAYRFNN